MMRREVSGIAATVMVPRTSTVSSAAVDLQPPDARRVAADDEPTFLG
jgi:hypothetical protein